MRTSEQTNEIAKALAAAQAAMNNAVLNKEAGGTDSKFKYRYADLAAVREAIIPKLAANGIAVTQATEVDEAGFRLITRLSHISGQWMEGIYPLSIVGNPQAMGSAITYARRYTLSAMCGISSEEDDDAQIAVDNSKREVGTQRNTKTVANGGQKSAYAARKEGDWPVIMQELESQPSRESLLSWYKANKDRITKMPEGWQNEFFAVYDDKLASFPRADVTMAG